MPRDEPRDETAITNKSKTGGNGSPTGGGISKAFFANKSSQFEDEQMDLPNMK